MHIVFVDIYRHWTFNMTFLICESTSIIQYIKIYVHIVAGDP